MKAGLYFLFVILLVRYPSLSFAEIDLREISLLCEGKAISDANAEILEIFIANDLTEERLNKLRAVMETDVETVIELTVLESDKACTGSAIYDLSPVGDGKLPIECEPKGRFYKLELGCNEAGKCRHSLEIDRRSLEFAIGISSEVDGSIQYGSVNGACEIFEPVI